MLFRFWLCRGCAVVFFDRWRAVCSILLFWRGLLPVPLLTGAVSDGMQAARLAFFGACH